MVKPVRRIDGVEFLASALAYKSNNNVELRGKSPMLLLSRHVKIWPVSHGYFKPS